MVSSFLNKPFMQEIGVGVFDVLESKQKLDIENYVPKSTEQIVKVKRDQEDQEDSEGSDDSGLYMNFESSEDESVILEKISQKKKPLI